VPLALTGRGDPTGRGRGFAFGAEDPKRIKEEAAPPSGLKAAADGSITGAGARACACACVCWRGGGGGS
jgi:hypothetical protein